MVVSSSIELRFSSICTRLYPSAPSSDGEIDSLHEELYKTNKMQSTTVAWLATFSRTDKRYKVTQEEAVNACVSS
jgi:hypothetical protein